MLAANCQNHFWLPKKNWQPKVVLAVATCGISRKHTETKTFGRKNRFWQNIAKTSFGCQFFFWLQIHFWLATYVCMTGTNLLISCYCVPATATTVAEPLHAPVDWAFTELSTFATRSSSESPFEYKPLLSVTT
mgnify:CR=1 FL=1